MREKVKLLVVLALLAVCFWLLYRDVVLRLARQWATDDNYSHGFLVAPIALYFVWERWDRLRGAACRPSILGLFVILGSLGMLVLGVLGAELFLTRISLLGTLAGAVLFVYGWPRLRVLAFPLVFLLLMIPIPTIIFNQIVFPLQLLAARFGEVMLSALDVPVLREGNLIVLASTTLEITEACSGIRSLVSLLTLGIIFGYFTDPRASVRFAIALSTIPVAIIANGLRLLGTGLAVQYYGPEAAEAFFHAFSGWLIFIVASSMIFAVQRVIIWFAPLRDQPSQEARLEGGEIRGSVQNSMLGRTIVVALCLAAGATYLAVVSETEATPIREPLSRLPLRIAEWTGRPTLQFSEKVVAVLGVDEYVSRFYRNHKPGWVHLYIGYYQSQRQGDTIHSPQNCLPGAGWQPVQSGRTTIPVGAPHPIMVNRYVVQKGMEKQVVLYWYQSHGRVIASEYWGKIYLVLDAISMKRTDGALVRVISPVVESEEVAEQQAIDFVKALFPSLGRHLPA